MEGQSGMDNPPAYSAVAPNDPPPSYASAAPVVNVSAAPVVNAAPAMNAAPVVYVTTAPVVSAPQSQAAIPNNAPVTQQGQQSQPGGAVVVPRGIHPVTTTCPNCNYV